MSGIPMHLVSDEELLSRVSRATYDKGRAYLRREHLSEFTFTLSSIHARCEGSHGQSYDCELRVVDQALIPGCTCEASLSQPGCKHLVALALAWRESRELFKPRRFERVEIPPTQLDDFPDLLADTGEERSNGHASRSRSLTPARNLSPAPARLASGGSSVADPLQSMRVKLDFYRQDAKETHARLAAEKFWWAARCAVYKAKAERATAEADSLRVAARNAPSAPGSAERRTSGQSKEVAKLRRTVSMLETEVRNKQVIADSLVLRITNLEDELRALKELQKSAPSAQSPPPGDDTILIPMDEDPDPEPEPEPEPERPRKRTLEPKVEPDAPQRRRLARRASQGKRLGAKSAATDRRHPRPSRDEVIPSTVSQPSQGRRRRLSGPSTALAADDSSDGSSNLSAGDFFRKRRAT